jgi:hypothetical protein
MAMATQIYNILHSEMRLLVVGESCVMRIKEKRWLIDQRTNPPQNKQKKKVGRLY